MVAGPPNAAASDAVTGHRAPDHDRLRHVAARPRRVDTASAEILGDLLAVQRRLDDRLGARAVLPVAISQHDPVGELTAEAASSVRPAVVRTGAQWAQFRGRLHLSAGDFQSAGVMFDRALERALEVDDREITATVLNFKEHAAWLGGGVWSA